MLLYDYLFATPPPISFLFLTILSICPRIVGGCYTVETNTYLGYRHCLVSSFRL